MPPVPQITVTLDMDSYTYTFSTANPSVTPGSQPLPVILGGMLTIGSGNSYSGITVVATLPASARVTTPFSPALGTVGPTYDQYTLAAVGMVTLSVPSYQGRPLTGTPLVVAPWTQLTLTESGTQTAPVGYGALVNLYIAGLTVQQNADVMNGLFVGQGGVVTIAPSTGSEYELDDVDEGPYNVNTQTAKTVPLIGTINVSSLKKPHAS